MASAKTIETSRVFAKSPGVVNQVTDIPVTGKTSGGGTFAGTLDLINFAVQGNQVVAEGLLSGTITDRAGNVVGTVTDQAVALPVDFGQAACNILNLKLGPLDLNLLGLRVQLNQINLDITAIPGQGLLGDLLCAVANLLNQGGALTAITDLLNQILGILQGLGL